MDINIEHVKQVAARQLADDTDGGGALCIYLNGQEVLFETWGLSDHQQGKIYEAETLQIAQSMGKGVIGALAAFLIDRGILDPLERVGHYWPEFAAAGKQAVTVAQLLSHQAGLPTLRDGLSLSLYRNRPALVDALAAQEPMWTPGTRHGYHPQTFGDYADELFLRASGKRIHELLTEQVNPLLGTEIHVGLPVELQSRAARVLPPTTAPDMSAPFMQAMLQPGSITNRVMTGFPEATADPEFVNGQGLRAVSMPAANMFTNVRSLARLYACLGVDGISGGAMLASPAAMAVVTDEQVRGDDAVLGVETSFGLGFMKPSSAFPLPTSPRAFGHSGSGGSVAFADPDHGLALSWMTTRYGTQLFDDRARALLASLYTRS
jgi:CubicO group peptidase (beta-lactamase class C family)